MALPLRDEVLQVVVLMRGERKMDSVFIDRGKVIKRNKSGCGVVFHFLFKICGVFYFVILHGVQCWEPLSGLSFFIIWGSYLFYFYVTVITHFEAEEAML